MEVSCNAHRGMHPSTAYKKNGPSSRKWRGQLSQWERTTRHITVHSLQKDTPGNSYTAPHCALMFGSLFERKPNTPTMRTALPKRKTPQISVKQPRQGRPGWLIQQVSGPAGVSGALLTEPLECSNVFEIFRRAHGRKNCRRFSGLHLDPVLPRRYRLSTVALLSAGKIALPLLRPLSASCLDEDTN